MGRELRSTALTGPRRVPDHLSLQLGSPPTVLTPPRNRPLPRNTPHSFSHLCHQVSSLRCPATTGKLRLILADITPVRLLQQERLLPGYHAHPCGPRFPISPPTVMVCPHSGPHCTTRCSRAEPAFCPPLPAIVLHGMGNGSENYHPLLIFLSSLPS